MTETQRAYWAGFFDHNGTIQLRPARGCHRELPILRVVWTKDVCSRVAMAFGGKVVQHIPARDDQWRWDACGRNAQRIIMTLRPWMVARAELADRIIAWQPGQKSRGASQNYPIGRWEGLVSAAPRLAV